MSSFANRAKAAAAARAAQKAAVDSERLVSLMALPSHIPNSSKATEKPHSNLAELIGNRSVPIQNKEISNISELLKTHSIQDIRTCLNQLKEKKQPVVNVKAAPGQKDELQEYLDIDGLQISKSPKDGNCFFHSLSRWFAMKGDKGADKSFDNLRAKTIQEMRKPENREDLLLKIKYSLVVPFIEKSKRTKLKTRPIEEIKSEVILEKLGLPIVIQTKESIRALLEQQNPKARITLAKINEIYSKQINERLTEIILARAQEEKKVLTQQEIDEQVENYSTLIDTLNKEIGEKVMDEKEAQLTVEDRVAYLNDQITKLSKDKCWSEELGDAIPLMAAKAFNIRIKIYDWHDNVLTIKTMEPIDIGKIGINLAKQRMNNNNSENKKKKNQIMNIYVKNLESKPIVHLLYTDLSHYDLLIPKLSVNTAPKGGHRARTKKQKHSSRRITCRR